MSRQSIVVGGDGLAVTNHRQIRDNKEENEGKVARGKNVETKEGRVSV